MGFLYLILFSIGQMLRFFLFYNAGSFLLPLYSHGSGGIVFYIVIIFVGLSLASSFGVLYEKKWALYVYNILAILLIIFLIIIMISTYKAKGYVPLDTREEYGITLELWNSAANKALFVQSTFFIVSIIIASLGFVYLAKSKAIKNP